MIEFIVGRMLEFGWHLHPVLPNSKAPATEHGYLDATNDRATLEAWNHRGNWGVACGASGLIVVDLDPRSMPAGQDPQTLLEELPPSFTVRTAGGGWHVYYRGSCRGRTAFLPGVDIKSQGGYVVAPGATIHGVPYRIERDVPVDAAPEWLVAAIGQRPTAAVSPTERAQGPTPPASDVHAVVEAFRASGPPKAGGHDVLFCATEILARGPWPDVAIVDAVERIGEAIGRAPGEGARVSRDHLRNRESGAAGRYGKPKLAELYGIDAAALIAALEPAPLALASARPEPVPLPLPPTAAAWTLLEGSLIGASQTVERALRAYRAAIQVRRDPGETPELQSSTAVIRWLVEAKGWSAERVAAELGPDAGHWALTLRRESEVQVVGRLTRIDQLLGRHELRWNEMALRIEIDGRGWSDNDTAQARIALEQSGASDPEKPIPNGDIEQRARALSTPYHPVADYLAELPAWDGVARVDRLWGGYFGAEDCELNRKLSACFALGAVRRVLEPGCKLDMMPILYGSQGEFKSSGLSALVGGPPFFTDAAPGFSHRSENAMTVSGCWVWEIAEMQGMDRADQNAVKAFVTRCEDDVLLPYARTKTRLPRRSVTIGTTNDEACLNDPTGSRRHPVITIGEIDRAGLVRDRDQFWAEALQRVRAGEPHWLAKNDEQAMGQRNADRHTKRDEVTVAALLAWFALPPASRFRSAYERQFPPRDVPREDAEFTMRDAVLYAFDGKADPGLPHRIGAALKVLGVAQRRAGRAKLFMYRFPE